MQCHDADVIIWAENFDCIHIQVRDTVCDFRTSFEKFWPSICVHALVSWSPGHCRVLVAVVGSDQYSY